MLNRNFLSAYRCNLQDFASDDYVKESETPERTMKLFVNFLRLIC